MIDYRRELNDQQFDAVQNGDGPCLVLAGAGSGKTRTITYRVAWLLEHGVQPENILLLTFTNKAAREMIKRVEVLMEETSNIIYAGTFHSVANRLLRQHARLVGYAPNFTILDQEDSRDVISLCLRELEIDTKNKRFPKPTVLQDIISYASNKHDQIDIVLKDRYTKFLHLRSQIEQVADTYSRLKKLQNSMDFDDLLLNLRLLLAQDETTRTQLSTQFQYVLVDEFQDTNAIQADIINMFADVHKNVFVVGDDAQSIYSFRAADIQNILRFPKQHPNTKIFHLTKNYRSTPEILSVANASIVKNIEQYPKELEPILASGKLPKLVVASHAAQEARFIADIIEKNVQFSQSIQNMAVLFRAAFHSQALEFELLRRNIKYEYRGGMKFFERAHIKDIIAYLRLLQNVKDTSAWMRVLRVFPGIGLVTAQKIATECSALESIADVVSHLPTIGVRAKEGWNLCVKTFQEIVNAQQSPAQFIRACVSTDAYQDYLLNEYQNVSERLDDLEQFAIFAEQEKDLAKFLDVVALTQEYNEFNPQNASEIAKSVVLSTIHQAKGLEWETVFVINLAEGAFPHQRVMIEEGGLEEERRLFYVALTRAKKELFLTYPITTGHDSVEYCRPSRFIDELPKNCYESIKISSSGQAHLSKRNADWYVEPTIVLSSDGEIKRRTGPSSFLRDV